MSIASAGRSSPGYWWLKWLLLVAMLLAPFISGKMPTNWWQENSPIEWAQAGILAAGLAVSVSRARTAAVLEERFSARFWAWSAVPWLVMIGRELSWGRVLFPVGQDENGPVFVPMRDLWFGHLIHAFVVLVVLVWIYAVIRHRLYGVPIDLHGRGMFPWIEAALSLVGFAYALMAAKVAGSAMLEEVVETLAFVGLVVLALRFPLIVRGPTPAREPRRRPVPND